MAALELPDCELDPKSMKKPATFSKKKTMKKKRIELPIVWDLPENVNLKVARIMQRMEEWVEQTHGQDESGKMDIIESINRLPDYELNCLGLNDKGILHLIVMRDELMVFLPILMQRKELDVNVEKNSIMRVTPLILAAMFGRCEVIRMLLEDKRCEIDKTTTVGLTALMVAVLENHVTVVQTLLHYGANKSLRSNSGRTAIEYAMERGHTRIIGLLK